MNTHYEDHWHKAVELRAQTHDLINDTAHPMARQLQHQTSQLVEDIELNRRPRSIEERIERIQHQLVEARAQGDEVLSMEHNNHLHQGYSQMRDGIRRLPHY